MVPDDYDERDQAARSRSRSSSTVVGGPGLGLNDIEEVARVDEHVRFLVDDLINRFERIVVDLLFPEVHPALGIETVERGWR